MKKIRIGSGAGYAGDRIEPAVELIEKAELDYIIFECLAERTIAIGQKEKAENPDKGYNHLLEKRMRSVLKKSQEKQTKIITNMGSANPIAALNITKEIAKELGMKNLKIAAILGDDILNDIDKYYDKEILEFDGKLDNIKDKIISANVYLGADAIVEALELGADVIITGRVADPSLTLGPLMYEWGWNIKDSPYEMGQGVLMGHLLECGGQVTGGYFADPGYKEVPNLENLGFPFIEVEKTGNFIITKVKDSGGVVSTNTCKEQILYEVHDPSKYLTPDAIADFSKVRFTQLEKDVVSVRDASSLSRPDTLKVSVGYKDGFIGEGEISYGGSNALNRAKLAADIIQKRLEIINAEIEELRIDFIGFNSLYGDKISMELSSHKPLEIRLRISGRTKDIENSRLIGEEVEALYTNGPAGGGGVSKSTNEIISICSIFIERKDIETRIIMEEI